MMISGLCLLLGSCGSRTTTDTTTTTVSDSTSASPAPGNTMQPVASPVDSTQIKPAVRDTGMKP